MTNNNRMVPVEVMGLGSGVTAISAGNISHLCQFTVVPPNAGEVRQLNGQLGDNSIDLSLVPVDVVQTPVQVLALMLFCWTADVTAISVGEFHTCAASQWRCQVLGG